jgi:hypothetical protein
MALFYYRVGMFFLAPGKKRFHHFRDGLRLSAAIFGLLPIVKPNLSLSKRPAILGQTIGH